MNRKILITMQRMSDNPAKNLIMASRIDSFDPSFNVSLDFIEDVINSKCRTIKKLRFLNLLFRARRAQAHELFIMNKEECSELINKFIYKNIPTGNVSHDIKLYKELRDLLNTMYDIYYDFYIESYCNLSTIELFSNISDSLLENNLNKQERDFILTSFEELQLKLYDRNFGYFIKDNINLDNNKLKEKIINYYGDINYKDEVGTLLHRCYFGNANLKEIGMMTKKLLEIGVNPNVLSRDGYSFVTLAIEGSKGDNDFIYNIINEALKYGFDVNNDREILSRLFYNTTDISKNLNLILDNGLDVSNFDIKEIINSPWKKENFKEINLIISYVYNSQIIDYIMNKLINEDYRLEEYFFLKIYKSSIDVNDILEKIRNLSSLDSVEEFGNLWVSTIIENRKNSVNVNNDEITAIEAVRALKLLLNNLIIKFNADIQDWENKVLIYENKNNN